MSYLYVKQSDNTVHHINELRLQYPNVSIPEGGDMSHLGYVLLQLTPRPAPQPWYNVVEGKPVNNVQTWKQVPMGSNEVADTLSQALDSHYDAKAAERQYDSRFTCALRAGYAGPYQAEGMAFAKWMDACNVYAYQQIDKITSGQRPTPTVEQFIAELPALTW